MELPEAFERYTRELMGEHLYRQFKDGLDQPSPVSIRINPFKYTLNVKDIPSLDSMVPWCRNGIYLKDRPAFTFDPLLHAGVYYVQEASSMFLDHVLRQVIHQPVTALDLCAAPGGKTTCAMSALPQGSILFSNEPIHNRAQILNENILKFGHPDIIVTNNAAKDYQKSGIHFDLILTDVPCSGEGMFRKDEKAIHEWSSANIGRCQTLQRDIVSDIWPCLKPGGLMVYSTCTFNAEEDEKNVMWIASELGADFIPVTTQPEWKITGALYPHTNASAALPVYRFIPGRTKGEGLFLAILKKRGVSALTAGAPSWRSIEKKTEKYLKVLSHGICPDEQKGKERIPDISKALSLFSGNNYFRINVDASQAITYLRREALMPVTGCPTGIVLICYKDFPLGFAKNIGHRINNLYPKEWKIKSTHIQNINNKVINI
jgi:16S rRNA C967 or C1407 C5-methylase (RsmB/RsmF family)/NOL1/NOP2/fmu family ribosome biogenesis protein